MLRNWREVRVVRRRLLHEVDRKAAAIVDVQFRRVVEALAQVVRVTPPLQGTHALLDDVIAGCLENQGLRGVADLCHQMIELRKCVAS